MIYLLFLSECEQPAALGKFRVQLLEFLFGKANAHHISREDSTCFGVIGEDSVEDYLVPFNAADSFFCGLFSYREVFLYHIHGVEPLQFRIYIKLDICIQGDTSLSVSEGGLSERSFFILALKVRIPETTDAAINNIIKRATAAPDTAKADIAAVPEKAESASITVPDITSSPLG